MLPICESFTVPSACSAKRVKFLRLLPWEWKAARDAAGTILEQFPRTSYGPMAALLSAKVHFQTGDLKTARAQLQWAADNARSDSARRASLDRVVASLNIVRDSLGLLSTRVVKMQGDVRGDLYNVGQQLLQIQELTGQSQQRVQELRASLEAKQSDISASSAPAGAPPAMGAPAASIRAMSSVRPYSTQNARCPSFGRSRASAPRIVPPVVR